MRGNSQKRDSLRLPCKRYRHCPHDGTARQCEGSQNALDASFAFWEALAPGFRTFCSTTMQKHIALPTEDSTVTFRAYFHTSFLLLIAAAHITVAHTSLQAEDWSIRKINPFGSRPRPQEKSGDEKPQAQNEKPAEAAEEDDTLARPLTAVEIRKSFSRIGQETAAAFSRTRAALTPEFQWFRWEPPRIRFPRLRPQASSEPGVPAEVVSQKK